MTDYAKYLGNDRYVIYLFHGVIPEDSHTIRNYTHKHITTDRFTKILGSLSKSGNPVSIPDIVESHRLPKRSFAITFDDGFENNYSHAVPVLQDYQIPATFYITTDFIETNSLSWIDMIEYAVEKTDVLQMTTRQKKNLLDNIRSVVKTNSQVKPYEFAKLFCHFLNIEHFTPDPELDQKMNWKQVSEINVNPLFTIGGHNHIHRNLAYLNQEELEEEIRLCLSKLHEQLNTKIKYYSYPEGLSYCYSDAIINTLKRYGIVCSLTAEHGVNSPKDDLFKLKRIAVI